MANCPKGYYWDGERCRKSIRMRRKGVYGKGFLSEPRKEQEAKIRKEEKIEGPVEVERQMSALNAFSHGKGDAHKDLKYAERIAHQDPRCPVGQVYVHGTRDRNGRWIPAHCRKVRRKR